MDGNWDNNTDWSNEENWEDEIWVGDAPWNENSNEEGAEQQPQTISGIGIQNDEDEFDFMSALQAVNANNAESFAKEEMRLQEEEKAKEEADKKAREEAYAKFLQERHEEEVRAKEKREQEEAEEARRYEEELEAKRQANPLRKMAGGVASAAADIARKSAETRARKKEELEAKKVEAQSKENPGKEEKQPRKNEKTEEKEKSKKKKEGKKEKPEEAKKEKGKEKPDFEYLATHDSLTGLKNATAYNLEKENIPEKGLAILFCDINNLKKANDTMGHEAGNKLIIAAAQSLQKLYGDSVYRIGGDEFVVLLTGKKAKSNSIETSIAQFQAEMEQKTKEDEDGLVYAASIGYAIGDGSLSKEELQAAADKQMYANKEAYKKAHPEEEGRPAKHISEKKESPQAPVDYDSLLPESSRVLKEIIRENHDTACEQTTERIIAEIQRRCNEILAILIASPTFDHLFIIQDVERFIDIVAEMDNLIDYSYLYVVYEGGPQYYGTDEYYNEVTHLFEEVAKKIKYSASISDKELLKIKGINVFKNIYIE